MQIRPARTDELELVSKLLDLAWSEYDARVGGSAERQASYAAYRTRMVDVWSRLDDGSILLVAEHDGAVAGTVTYYPPKAIDEDDWPAGCSSVRLLGVDPAARGNGVGRAMAEHCIARARGDGATAVGLHTTDLMRVARDLYLRMGFVREPARDFRIDDGFIVEAYRLDL